MPTTPDTAASTIRFAAAPVASLAAHARSISASASGMGSIVLARDSSAAGDAPTSSRRAASAVRSMANPSTCNEGMRNRHSVLAGWGSTKPRTSR